MFSTQLLKSQPGRYALIAESVLPIFLILILGSTLFNPGKTAGANVAGRPVPAVFAIVWVLVTIMLLLALVIVALNVENVAALCLVGIFSLIGIIMSFVWLIVYKKSKEHAAQVLLLAFVFMVATTITVLGSQCNENAKMTAGIFFGLSTAWLNIASMLNYLEINKN